MNDAIVPNLMLTEAVLEALPIGIAIIDADQRIVLFNAAYCESLDLPPNSFPRGTKVADALRVSAYRGVFGPGDPESQVSSMLGHDRSQSGRLRRRTFNGRTFDVLQAPLAQGGYVTCVFETTALVTARRDSEQAIGRLRTSLGAVRAGIAAFGSDRTLLFCNAPFSNLLGLPQDRLTTGLPFASLLELMAEHDELASLDGATFITAQRDVDRSRPSEARRVRANGQVVDIASDPLPDGGWTMTVSDVSALAHAEDEARRRATLLQSILDAFPHGVCVYDANRRVSMFNRTYTDVMAGAPLAVGDHLQDIIRARAAAGEYGPGDVDTIFAEQMAFNLSRPQMRKRRRPNGMTVDVRTSPLPDGGYISVVTDITALAEAEQEVSRRAEQLAVMLSNIRQGVVLWGPDKRLVGSNDAAAQLLELPTGLLTPGCTQAELLGYLRRRGHFGDGEQADARVDALMSIDRSKTVVRESVTASGRMLSFRSDPTPDGGWLGSFSDVTESRRAEEELRRARDAAEAANQAKSRFLATMSHELRTPLNAVIGFSESLLHEASDPAPQRIAEFAEQINSAGRNLLDLINQILDVARIEAGRFDLASDNVDVARLVRTSVRQSDAAVQAAELTLVIEVEAELPRFKGDERRMQQVLSHLLSNAVKFTNAGGTITVGATKLADDGLRLFVRDTGIGIPADDIERVFEPFTQLDSSLARRFHGAGLGLYVSRVLVTGHGGTLTLTSALDEGTTAEILLPAERMIRET
jgi:signal transduction histidine kinase